MISPLDIVPAIVKQTDPTARTLVVQPFGTDRQVTDVYVVNDPGNYAFPKINDVILLLSTTTRAYAVGVVQMRYANKLERKTAKDPETNSYVRADEVDNGGICIGNITNKTKLRIDNNGDFSFWSALFAGFSFEAMKQIFTFAANNFTINAGTVKSYIGSVFRSIPGTGNTPMQALPPIDTTGTPGFAAVEVMFDLLYRQLRLARFHLGHILNSVGVPELSSLAKPIRALLEVCLSGATICSMKMDEGGNIEVSTTIGKVIINSSIPLASVLIGGLTASQSAVFGDLLLTWLNSHTHSSSWGPTGPAISPATTSILSQKVKIG